MKSKWLPQISLLVLVIFHVVGLFLFANNSSASELSWLNLLISSFVLFLNAKDFTNELKVLIVIGLGGYLLEIIGVHTGVLFGSYAYETALGFKLFDVPVIIALNWYCIVIASSSLANTLPINLWIRSLVAATLGLLMDILIEPVAIKYHFWQWEGGIIPMWNYVCWFVALFSFSLVYNKIQTNRNQVGIGLFIIWLLFFLILKFVA